MCVRLLTSTSSVAMAAVWAQLGLSHVTQRPLSWHVTLNVRDVTVAAVHLHPLLHGPGHDLLGEPLGVLQQHRADLRRAHLRVDQVGLLAPGSTDRLLCGVCILGPRVTPLGFDAPHALGDVALVWVGGVWRRRRGARVFGQICSSYVCGFISASGRYNPEAKPCCVLLSSTPTASRVPGATWVTIRGC